MCGTKKHEDTKRKNLLLQFSGKKARRKEQLVTCAVGAEEFSRRRGEKVLRKEGAANGGPNEVWLGGGEVGGGLRGEGVGGGAAWEKEYRGAIPLWLLLRGEKSPEVLLAEFSGV